MGTAYASAAYRELGAMLRQVRENAGLSSTELARKIDWPLTKLSRMEHGWRPCSTIDVILYCVCSGLSMTAARPYLELARRAERKQGFYLSDNRIGGSLQTLIFHESSANHSVVFEPHLMPGLLQTPEYARARILSIDPDMAEDRVAATIRTRMERRQVLYRPNPSRFTFYLQEKALQLRVGTDEVMHEQLLHLVLTAALDNVSVRVVPRKAGEIGEGFHLMTFEQHRPIVYLDNLRFGGLVLEDTNYVENYYEIVPFLDSVALDEGQSREFVAHLAYVYDRGSRRGVPDLLAQEQLQQLRGNELRGSGLAEEQPQQLRGNRLRGGGVVEPPTPIYE
jgi:uncharacterized protein DUF5753/helix-turn-helix protein